MRRGRFILNSGIMVLCLFNISECFARRIYTPLSFIEKLTQCLQDPSIDEAIRVDFFRENWELLNGGIRVNISDKAFLEIRKTGQNIIVQLLGHISTSERMKLAILRENLVQEAAKFNISVSFIYFSNMNLSQEPISLYSILDMSDADFELVAQDVLRGGDGSGMNSLPLDVIKAIDFMYNTIIIAVGRGVLNPNDLALKLNKDTLVDVLDKSRSITVQILHKIEDGEVFIPIERRREIVNALINLKDGLKNTMDILQNENSDILFRVLYRECIEPYLKSMEFVSRDETVLERLSRRGFYGVSLSRLRDGLHIDVGERTFVEIRLNDRVGITQVVGMDFPPNFPELYGQIIAKFQQLCQQYGLSLIVGAADVFPNEPVFETYSIVNLTDKEFDVVCRDAEKNGGMSGYSGLTPETVDFINAMYIDVRREAERINFNWNEFLFGKEALINFLSEVMIDYSLGLRSGGRSITLTGGMRMVRDKAKKRLKRYQEYINILHSEIGNLIYRVFYRDFLRKAPEIMKILNLQNNGKEYQQGER